MESRKWAFLEGALCHFLNFKIAPEIASGARIFEKFGTPTASVYAGQWQEGKKHGKGKLTLYSGNCYDGQWKADKRHGWGMYTVAEPTTAGMAAYEGEWVEDARTGRGISKGKDGHVELCTYNDGKRVGEGVRLLDESKLKASEPKGPFVLIDGKVGDEISMAEAEAIAGRIGFKGLPTLPWPPVATSA